MIRSLRFAAFACTVLLLSRTIGFAQEKQQSVNVSIAGQIVESDAKDTVRLMPCKVHILKLEKGRTYLIDMVSTVFDSYLRVEDSAGTQLAQDDDGGGNLNARIRFTPNKDDSFKIIATTFSGGEGDYTLTVKDQNAPVALGKPPAVKLVKEIPKKEAPKKVETVKEEPKKADAKPTPDGSIKLETPTENKTVDVQGQLQDGDGIDPVQNHTAKNYVVELNEGMPYIIAMNSTDFDAFLIIRNADGKELAKDDDSGGNLNARVFFVPPAKGSYRIVATSFGGGNGNFQLVIRPATEFGKAVKYDAEKVHEVTTSFFVPGALTNQDAKDAVQQQSPCQIHQMKLEKGKTYVVDLMSGQMDCYLRIEDSKKNNLAEDDDGGEGLNSRLSFSPTEDGVYRLIATNLNGGPVPIFLQSGSKNDLGLPAAT